MTNLDPTETFCTPLMPLICVGAMVYVPTVVDPWAVPP